MNEGNLISLIHSSSPPLVKFLTILKASSSKSQILFGFSIFFKLYGFLILSSNCCYKSTLNSSLIKFTSLLRKLTLFDLYTRNINFVGYIIISVGLIIIQISIVFYLLLFFRKMEKKKKLGEIVKIPQFPKIIYYFHILFSQHILEHFILIILIWTNPKIENSNSFYTQDDNYKKYFNNKLFQNEQKNSFVVIFFFVLNLFGYLFEVLICCYIYPILNSPFFTTNSPMRFRHNSFFIFGLISQLFLSFHFAEIYLSETKLKVYHIITFFSLLIIITVYIWENLKNAEIKTKIYYLFTLMLFFILTSLIIEIFVSLSDYTLTNPMILYIFLIKLFVGSLFFLLLHYTKDKIMHNLCVKTLFNVYEDSTLLNNTHIESFYYLIEKLLPFSYIDPYKKTNSNNSICDTISIIINHEKSCKNEECKCHSINIIPNNCTDNTKFKNHLVKRIGFLIETSFIKINYTTRNNYMQVIFLSEYFFVFRKNAFMAYSITHSFLNYNYKRLSSTQLIMLYTLQYNYIKWFLDSYYKHDSFLKFNYVVKDEQFSNQFNTMLIDYCQNNIDLINLKESIESSIKIDCFEGTTDIRKISSKSLTNITNQVIFEYYKKQFLLYKKIKHKAKKFQYNKKSYSYYFKICIFFQIFSSKIPKYILQKFSLISQNKESFTGVSYNEIKEKFDQYLTKMFNKGEDKNHYIILKCNKGIRIKSISVGLCNTLNFVYPNIINEKLDSIFPSYLKDIHKRAIFGYLSENKNNFCFSKKTFIFDFQMNAIPCRVKAAVFPHLSKNLLIICEIILLERDYNILSILVDQFYDTLAISKSMEKNLSITMEIIKKYEINLLEIFDIGGNFIPKIFRGFIKKSQAYSKKLLNNINAMFGRYFYSVKHANDEGNANYLYDNKKIRIKECAEAVKIEKIKQSKVVEKKRSIVFQNLRNILTQYSETELKDDMRMKFSEMYTKFKQATLLADNNEEDLLYTIKITGEMVFNYPLFIIEMKLAQKNIDAFTISSCSQSSTKKSKFGSTRLFAKSYSSSRLPMFELDDIEKSKFLDNKLKKTGSYLENNKKSSFSRGVDLTPKLSCPQTPKNINVKPIETTMSITFENMVNKNQIKQTPLKIDGIHRTSLVIETHKKRIDKGTIITKGSVLIISIFVIILLVISIYLFVMHSGFFQRISLLVDCIFSNYFQRDKLALMISSFYTFTSHLVGTVVTEYDLSVYLSNCKNSTTRLEESFSIFYSFYKKYNVLANKNYSEILNEYEYKKIVLNFNQISYYSDYASEIYHLLYTGLKFINEEKDEKKLISDVSLLFKYSFLSTPNKEVQTNLGRILYYMLENGNKLYSNVIEKIDVRLNEDLENTLNSLFLQNLLCEGILVVGFSLSFIYTFILLFKYNKIIFHLLVSIFLIQEGGQEVKLNINLMTTQSLTLFVNLLKNFNFENYLQFKKRKVEITNQKPSGKMISSTTGTDQVSLSTLNNTNSQNLNSCASIQQTNKGLLSNSRISGRSTNSISLLQKLNNNNINPNLIPKRYQSNTKYPPNVTISPSLFELKYFKIITIFKAISICLFILCLIFCVIRYYLCFFYIKDIRLTKNYFLFLSGKYAITTIVFNSIRKCMHTSNTYLSEVDQFSNWLEIIDSSSNLIESSSYKFPLTNQFLEQNKMKMSDKKINLNLICGDSQICINELKLGNQNNYCNDGVDLGLKTILQKFTQIISELGRISNEDINLKYITDYVKNNKLSTLESTVEFIIQQVQVSLYDCFQADHTNLRKTKERNMRIVNFTTIILGLGFIVAAVILINVVIKNMFEIVFFGTKKTKLLLKELYTEG